VGTSEKHLKRSSGWFRCPSGTETTPVPIRLDDGPVVKPSGLLRAFPPQFRAALSRVVPSENVSR